ncbi:hypothetical protein Pyrde_0910 [Pyrodictium delaneyi]|uniref:Type II toxin-antitoxin system HicB family antitoxin n=1 Tax=Pyrodictium delaneyi TaxID=1273541 RepID=A0A0P0N4A7_9CREN|nr:hypothetical protein [Pyrodictium delaneyi]ALL00958.1 hypothetical protein Pyrde_0910 [Pyrodictium delaneyi]OWJ55777.1 hypothetical protein Pdsh_01100 [Pyrodictium delaneyi]
MARRVKVGIVVYKEVEEDGTTWYVAVEPMSGAQAQGESLEEAIEKVKEEVVRMSEAWCESEVREAVDAKIVEVELPE